MPESAITEQLIDLLRRRPGSQDVPLSADDPLEGTDIDSIDLAYVLAHFERAYDADFEDLDFALDRYQTVGDLGRAIEDRING